MNRLKELREESGMKQIELASRFGVAQTAVSKYELGQLGMNVEIIDRACDVFNCTADYLLGRSDVRLPVYSEDEAALVLAYRRADERARTMVELALEPYTEKKNAEPNESTAS